MLDCIVQIHRRSSTRLSRSKQHTLVSTVITGYCIYTCFYSLRPVIFFKPLSISVFPFDIKMSFYLSNIT
ncbi:unnamed protein product [Brassica rapa subsp. trilocularis]